MSLPADPRVLSEQYSYAIMQQPDGSQSIVLVENTSNTGEEGGREKEGKGGVREVEEGGSEGEWEEGGREKEGGGGRSEGGGGVRASGRREGGRWRME